MALVVWVRSLWLVAVTVTAWLAAMAAGAVHRPEAVRVPAVGGYSVQLRGAAQLPVRLVGVTPGIW